MSKINIYTLGKCVNVAYCKCFIFSRRVRFYQKKFIQINPINFHVFKADIIVFPCSDYEIQFPSRKRQWLGIYIIKQLCQMVRYQDISGTKIPLKQSCKYVLGILRIVETGHPDSTEFWWSLKRLFLYDKAPQSWQTCPQSSQRIQNQIHCASEAPATLRPGTHSAFWERKLWARISKQRLHTHLHGDPCTSSCIHT